MTITFANPLAFILLIIIPIIIYLDIKKNKKNGTKYSAVSLFPTIKIKWYKKYFQLIVRSLSILLLIFATTMPQYGVKKVEIVASGINMMLVMDTSGSMEALDFLINNDRQNRLFVIKSVLNDFIDKRVGDKIGLVVFGTEVATQCPLTLDHEALKNFINNTSIGVLGESTAIGDAIGLALIRLKDIKAKSKIIVLITDGSNNAGSIKPADTIKIAKTLGIKIYTIAVGTNGKVPIPINTLVGKQIVYEEMPIDEESLMQIASSTGGQFYRATDTQNLLDIYEHLNKLEKSEYKIKEFSNQNNLFVYFIIGAFILILIELLLSASKLFILK